MPNELVFIISCALIVTCSIGALKIGFEAIVAWVALQTVLANLFVLKQIHLMGLNATASDIFAIGCLFSLNICQEKYGKNASKKAVLIAFICMSFFCIFSQIHLLYAPSTLDVANISYIQLLKPIPRILFASLGVFFLVQLFDINFYAFLRKIFSNKPILLANTCSLVISQFLDTVLFSFLGLFGLVSMLGQIIVVSYSVKLVGIICIIFCSFIYKRFIFSNDYNSNKI